MPRDSDSMPSLSDDSLASTDTEAERAASEPVGASWTERLCSAGAKIAIGGAGMFTGVLIGAWSQLAADRSGDESMRGVTAFTAIAGVAVCTAAAGALAVKADSLGSARTGERPAVADDALGIGA